MSKGVLIVISGPSGTGKGTICAELLKDTSIYLSISMTSREMRAGETEDVTYHYTTAQGFKMAIEDGKMLEWAVYSGNYYGTPRDKVLAQLDMGKNVLLEIDVQGALQVKKNYPDATLIFILPPSIDELKKRLTERGRENESQIKERLDAAFWELTHADKYDYVVVNDDLMECVDDVHRIIETEKFRAKNNIDFIHELINERK